MAVNFNNSFLKIVQFGKALRVALPVAFAAVICGMGFAAAAPAQTAAQAPAPTKISQFEYWGAYMYKTDNQAICYILSTPTKQEPETVKHGDNFFLVSKRDNGKTGKIAFEPQFMAGYDLKAESHVTAMIGTKSFALFTRGNSAWVEGEKQEAELLAAMRGGSTMEIKAVSKRGTDTSYVYSLKGISAALKAAQKCK